MTSKFNYLSKQDYIFSINHKDNDDMLIQNLMRTLRARSSKLERIFHNCGTKVWTELRRSFCASIY